jgi:glycosyltransferase involved in cell wall biosynthesis
MKRRIRRSINRESDGTVRVLHVLSSLDDRSGGPLRAVLDLSSEALDLGLRSEVAGPGPLEVTDNPLDRDLIHVLPASFSSYGYSAGLRRWLDRHIRDYDGVVVHGMWLYPTWCTASACKAHGVPYAVFPHGMLDVWPMYGQGRLKATKKWLYWKLREKWIFQHSVCVFYTTRKEMRNADEVFRLDVRKELLIPYGAHLAGQSGAYGEPNADLLGVARGPFALFLGRLHPKKNVDFLVKAWAEAKVPSEWKLIIAGDGEASYKEQLHRLVHELGISERVHFVGHVTAGNKRYLLQSAEWFLLPSSQENFGIAPLEAIAAGCPVAISDQVYLAEYLHPQSEVLPLTMSTWVSFLKDRMTNKTHRENIFRFDKETVVPKFEMKSIAEAWAATLRSAFSASH